MSLLDRVKTRLGYKGSEEQLVKELLQTACDRIMLRAGQLPSGLDNFPEALASVAVDVSVKAYRRVEYEGISTEGSENMTTSFVDDLLSEYDAEITAYRDSQGTSSGVVRFL